MERILLGVFGEGDYDFAALAAGEAKAVILKWIAA